MTGRRWATVLAVLALAVALLVACGGSDDDGGSGDQAQGGPPASEAQPGPQETAATPAPTRTAAPTRTPGGTAAPAPAALGCEASNGRYASTVGHYLCTVSASFRLATVPCADITPPGPCRRAAARYQRELEGARAALQDLTPPAVAVEADRTMRGALDEAIAATGDGIAALDARDTGAWLRALADLSAAGASLQRAGAQLTAAIS